MRGCVLQCVCRRSRSTHGQYCTVLQSKYHMTVWARCCISNAQLLPHQACWNLAAGGKCLAWQGPICIVLAENWKQREHYLLGRRCSPEVLYCWPDASACTGRGAAVTLVTLAFSSTVLLASARLRTTT